MNCPACGGANRDGARFCRHCGRPIAQLSPAEGAVAAESPTMTAGVEASAGTEEEAEGAAGGQVDMEGVAVPASVPEGTQPSAEQDKPAEAPPASVEPGTLIPSVAPSPAVQPEPIPAGPEAGQEQEESGESCKPSPTSSLEQPPLERLPPGSVVAGRYLVVEALDVQESQIRYSARDLCRCRQCGFDGNAPDDAFCAQCGASLPGGRVTISLLQIRDSLDEPPAGEKATARLSDGTQHFLVLAERPREAALTEKIQPGLRLLLGQSSDPGQVRELNEDSLLTLTLGATTLGLPAQEGAGRPLLMGLFAVADGMGGHEGGEVASMLALQVLAREVVRAILLPGLGGDGQTPADPAQALARAMEAANDAVYLLRQKRESDMGTTLTVALICGDRLCLAHVGDCRAFRWSAGGLDQLTADHSVVAGMVAAGQVPPDAVYTHPQRSVIYRCIGDRPSVAVDTAELTLAPGDRLILCSDGLWEMIRNEGVEDVLMQEADPQLACNLLVARANAAGGGDNISVIVVQVESA